MGQKHKRFREFREFRTPFPLRDICENPCRNVRACEAGDGAICSKNRKIVPYHGANPNTRNGARLRSPSGRLYVGRWNERVRAKRCDAVDWGLLKQGDSTTRTWISKEITRNSLLCESGTFLLHFCSVTMGKGKFFRDETGLIISHCEWVKICSRWVVRVSFWRMNKDLCKKALFSGISRVNLWVSQNNA